MNDEDKKYREWQYLERLFILQNKSPLEIEVIRDNFLKGVKNEKKKAKN